MNGLYAKEDFYNLLLKESSRAERTSTFFSLLILDITPLTNNEHNMKALAFLLRKRIRCYDQMGWLDSSTICLFLPDTNSEGAQKVADSLCSQIATKKFKPFFKILTYPKDFKNRSSKGKTFIKPSFHAWLQTEGRA